MNIQSVVAFFAHPDDETVLAGGITAFLTRQGIPVHIVCATRGEGGELGIPPVATRETLGQVREAELRCAVRALGASLTILDYIDPTITPDEVMYPFQADLDTLTGQLIDIARRQRASVVLTHGADGEYGHPAHQLMHRAVMRGIPHALPNVLVYSVSATVPGIQDLLWNKNETAHLALDIRPWGEAKIAAMECHLSQHALFRRTGNLASVREALRTTESVRRAWPDTYGEPPDDAFAQLLKMAGAWTVKQ